MSNKLLLWFGPLSKMQVARSVPAGFTLSVLGCLGNSPDGKPTCGAHADAWKDADGRRVPRMRERMRLDSTASPFVAAFSAGGQTAKRLALHTDDLAEIAGMYLADATYTIDWAKKPTEARVDPIAIGFVHFALQAVKDGRWLVATASSSLNTNGLYPSGAQTLAAIRQEIEERSGQSFEDAREDPLLQGLRAPVRAERMNNVLLVDWGAAYQHGDHLLKIAPVVLPRVLAAMDA